MGGVFVFSLTAALNPTLLAAVTAMLTLPHTAPVRDACWRRSVV